MRRIYYNNITYCFFFFFAMKISHFMCYIVIAITAPKKKQLNAMKIGRSLIVVVYFNYYMKKKILKYLIYFVINSIYIRGNSLGRWFYFAFNSTKTRWSKRVGYISTRLYGTVLTFGIVIVFEIFLYIAEAFNSLDIFFFQCK